MVKVQLLNEKITNIKYATFSVSNLQQTNKQTKKEDLKCIQRYAGKNEMFY